MDEGDAIAGIRSAEVDRLLAERAHPLGEVVADLRDDLLAIPGVVETVKWSSPNYALDDDFATVHLRRPTAVQLILHTGARPKPEHAEILLEAPPTGLRWADRNRAVVTFGDAEAFRDERAAVRAALRRWVEQLDSA